MAGYVLSQGFEILALTETCLGNDTDQLVIGELVTSGYELRHVSRANQRRVVLYTELDSVLW